MDGASGRLELMGRDCSRPSPQASFSHCLIKLNYSASLRQTRLFIIIIIPIFNLARKLVKWELAPVKPLLLFTYDPDHSPVVATKHTQLESVATARFA